MFENIKLISRIDGQKIHLHIFSPTNEPPKQSTCTGVVLAVHGLCEHVDRYRQLAEITCQKNKIFAIFDMEGHGKYAVKKGDVQNLAGLILDVIQAFHFLKELFSSMDKDSFALLGHSFGGLQVTMAASILRQEVKKIFLSSPMYANKHKIPYVKKLIANSLKNLLPTLDLPIGIKSSEISKNPQNNATYKKDSLILNTMTARFGKIFLDCFNMDNTRQSIANITAEATFIIPCDDKLIDSQVTKKMLTLFKVKPKAFEIKDCGHEAFNEVESVRKIAISHYKNWLDSI